VGAYLSGGLDSSIITTLIHDQGDVALRSFSLGFHDAEFDEREHQQALVRHLGSAHSELRVGRPDIAAAFARAVRHAEAPLLRTAPVPMMLLADHVREAGFKVVLTGEGADEVFAGYDLFREAQVRRFMARSPGSAWRGRILERLYPWLPHAPGRGALAATQFFRDGAEALARPWGGHATRLRAAGRVRQFLRPEWRQSLDAHDLGAELEATLPSPLSGWSPLHRDQYVEATTLLPGYLLASQGDRMAMAASIEARFPFLDHRLIAFAGGLPPGLKLQGLREKRVLKHAMAARLPASITARSKQPYRAPDSACFFDDGRPLPWVADLLTPDALDAAGLFEPGAVAKLVAKCAAGRAIGFPDNMAFTGILSCQLLHREFGVRA
jgi:asparagine synthase (glutamine-hydrolysing)